MSDVGNEPRGLVCYIVKQKNISSVVNIVHDINTKFYNLKFKIMLCKTYELN